MEPLTAIIDANAMGHSDQHGTTLTVGSSGFQTQAIFGTVKRTRDLVGLYPQARFLALWDGVAKFRFEEYPDYKSNRVAKTPEEEKEKSFYTKQIPLIRAAYKYLGITQLIPEELEADDLAGYFAGNISKKENVVLFTGDTDWLQMVNERTTWHDPRKEGKTINLSNFHESTGYFTPWEYIQGKALIGDSTDSIPPVGGIGKQTAPVFMAEFRSVENFWDMCEKGTYLPRSKAYLGLWKGVSELTEEQWLEANPPALPNDPKLVAKHLKNYPGQARLKWLRNMKLMVLSADASRIAGSKIHKISEPLNEPAFKQLCEKLSFISILKNFDNYMEPFRERERIRRSKNDLPLQ